MMDVSVWMTWGKRIALCVAAGAALFFAADSGVHAAGLTSSGNQPNVGQCQITHWTDKQDVTLDYKSGVSEYKGKLSIYGLYDNYFNGEFCGEAYVTATVTAVLGSRDTTIQAEINTDQGTKYGSLQNVGGNSGLPATSTTPAVIMSNATGIDLIGGLNDKSTYTWGTSPHYW